MNTKLRITLFLTLFFLLTISFTMVAYADSPIYVNDAIGNDACNGLTPDISGPNCPVKTIGQGVTLVDANGEVIVATGTYTENITINKNLTLQGAGAVGTIIDGSNSDRVITNTAVATITGVTIRNGNETEGGGIKNQGTLVLSDTIVTDNIATQDGGGIHNEGGALTIINSTITSNDAGSALSDNGVGGGIANAATTGSNATLTITGSVISNNVVDGVGGGGLSNSGHTGHTATITVDYSTISNNVATNATIITATTGFGGGIRNAFAVGASSGAAIVNVSHSTISDNTAVNGGGLGSGTSTTGNTLAVTIDSSTISGNTATHYGSNEVLVGNGGGLLNQNGTMQVVNSTVSGNTAIGAGLASFSGLGGGLANASYGVETTLWLTNTTVASNTAVAETAGTGLASVRGSSDNVTTNFNNTIVAGTCYKPTGPYGAGILTSQGYNLEYNTVGSNTCNLTATSDITGTDPLLGALQPNGGETQTHALGAQSPAIDTGDCVMVTDQRDVNRLTASPTPFCDMGAYESALPGYVDLEIDKTVSPIKVEAGNAITYTITFANNGWAPAAGVIITDIIPTELINLTPTNSGATITETTGYTYSWTVADLYRGDGGVITITAEVDPNANDGTVINTATITTTYLNPDSTPGNNENEALLTVGSGGGVYLPIIVKSF